MLRRPMRHCCLALRANDNRITAWHWLITPEHALFLDHPDHPYQPIEHQVLTETAQLRKFYTPARAHGWGYEATDLAKMLGCSPSMLHRARNRGHFREHFIPHLGGKRGKPVPILHFDRSLIPHGTWFFQPPHSILGGFWSWLPDLLPDNFQQSITRMPVFQTKTFSGADIPVRHLSNQSTDDHRFLGYRWLCPSCKKPVRKIYYPLPMRLLSGFLQPDPALLILSTQHSVLSTAPIDPALPTLSTQHSVLSTAYPPIYQELPEPPPTFACAKCHNLLHFTSLYKSGWNNLISHMTAGLLFGHEVTPPSWFELGGRKRPRIRQLHRPSPRRDMVLRRLLNGWSNQKIQRDLQISKGALDSHLHSLFQQHDIPDRHALVAKLKGITPPLNQHERAAQRRFQVQQLLLQGLSLKEMIKQLQTDYSTLMRDINSIYRHHDIPKTKGPNNARRALAQKLELDLPPIGAQIISQQIHSLRATGLSIPQIAQQLKRANGTIYRHLKKLPRASSPSPATAGEGRGEGLSLNVES